ncbi:protein CELLULOSE SYNTHASE INTERACTIVE 3 [Phalaenopsis equestris]|uniref:protein CELLULOSE SYNTHASE INTERACTIVE 3 n=1 Tax=Phalaenopsis equestris TaxID=78828 RepID=UPI0009E297E3|nr:protein CELLULOSE SYNTHASE INTERACTIVE 3 [Phalaenopsis equestris]
MQKARELRDLVSPSSSTSSSKSRDSDGGNTMDCPESTMANVAFLLEQLHAGMSSPTEKDMITAQLLSIARAQKEARTMIGSHSQAMPLLISMLRNGTPTAKANVAATLSALCKEEELHLKVLLGGCIPPLLSLLKSKSSEARKAAAEAIFEVSSGGLSDDHIGMKIFVTEGVVPTLWDLLDPNIKQDKVVLGFVTGALRNLCGFKDGYWKATLEAGGVDIITGLLSSDNTAAQANAASLLARLILAFGDSIHKVIDAGAVGALLCLLGHNNDISVRASAAEALEALSSKSIIAKKSLVDAGGIAILVGAVVAPSKECMQEQSGHALQRHAVNTLANICGSMSSLILYLGELAISPRMAAPVADIIGALAYALMVFVVNEEVFDPVEIEGLLIGLLKPHDNKLVQDRILEALASLYGNPFLASRLEHADAKRVLIGLITLAAADVQEQLILSFSSLCCEPVGIWESLRKREGVQLLISFLGLSTEQHQEYAVALLSILTDQVEESKWAITAAGGIPPLVQLLYMGFHKAREDAAHVLWNLCCHSDDIRACVESAGAVAALLSLLKNGGLKGQEVSAKALTKLIRHADTYTINYLLALLLSDSISSKSHAITVLGHVLTMSSHKDLVQKGAPANKGLKCLVEVLNSSNEETQECAASVLADLFSCRQDICDSLATDEIVHPCMKLLTSKTQVVATQSARALGALSRPNKANSPNKTKMSYIVEGDFKPLIKMAKTSSIHSAETAVTALANLLSDPQIAEEAITEDIVSALTRVMAEGSLAGKVNASCALNQLLSHFPVGDVLTENECQFVLLTLVESLTGMDIDGVNFSDSLDALILLAKTKHCVKFRYPLWFVFSKVPVSLEPLVNCLASGGSSVQDKAILILSRLCRDQSVTLGNLLVGRLGSITSLSNRILRSSNIEVRIGGASLLLCAGKDHKQQTLSALEASGLLNDLIYALVDMMKLSSNFKYPGTEAQPSKNFVEMNSIHRNLDDLSAPDPAATLAGSVSLWLVLIIVSYHAKSRITFFEARGVEAISDKMEGYVTNSQGEFDDTEGVWIGALLLAISFQEEKVIQSPTINRIIPSLSFLLMSDEINEKYFAAQAIASLVSTSRKAIHLAIANAGSVGGLLSLVGHVESEMPHLVALSEEFNLVRNPDNIALQHLFEIEDIRTGGIARKSIPLLVDLLRPLPDRPRAAPIAINLLTQLAEANDANKLFIAEAGALEALTKYLSLSPQDSTEIFIVDLLGILYSNPDILQHDVSLGSLSQLIAVLRLGSRRARFSAARALHVLFGSEDVRDTEMVRQAIQPLVDMLNAGSEMDQEAALVALIKLTAGNIANASALTDVEESPLESLYKILASSSSLKLKTNAAQLCYVIFGSSTVSDMLIASQCLQPLMSLMSSSNDEAMESGVRAFERLLDDEQLADIAAESNVVSLLVQFVSGSNHKLSEITINALIKLGKDRPHCKLEMVNAGIVDNALKILLDAPGSLCSLISELLRILTNNSGIAKSADAARMVEPLFSVLHRTDITLWGQHSTLQSLVNILEKPQSLAILKSTPSQVIEPLISFLESPSQAIQQLGTELLSHLLEQEHFQQDITTKNAVIPLVQLAGIGILSLQQTAIKSLESISLSWPKAVADAGGMFELSKVIVQDDPLPTQALWESAALVLSNILKSNPEYHFKVPPVVLVKLLHSTVESTVAIALGALIVQEKRDPSSSAMMAEAGAVDALLELLRCHQCEEASARLIEALFNNPRVREKKTSKYAIAPLSQYLLDPQTRSQPAKFLATLALGDLFQHDGLARTSDAVSACRALISLLEDQPTEEMKMVALCALQNLVMHSRTNRRAVAEAGGILALQELLLSQNAEVCAQAALLIKYLFSNHTLQEYVSNELIRSLTAALENELWSNATTNEEVLRTIYVIFSNFKKLRTSEAALCIPQLVGALKTGSEPAQDSVLDTLCLLKDSWSEMNEDIAKAQALIAAEAIPILQLLMKTCPPSFHERADSLLHCLPGCLTVTIKRGNNLKQTMGSTNAFCRLKIGNGPPRQTKVVSHNTCPEWKEGFTWAFDVPPKGQKLYILCKSKNTFGKTTLGRVTIQIDKVVTEGLYSGLFSLSHDNNKDLSRTLEIDILWSNRISGDEV